MFTDAQIAVLPDEIVQREARREALRASGVCTHALVWMLPDSGVALYSQQEGLKPGEIACGENTGGCAARFDSVTDWMAAREAL